MAVGVSGVMQHTLYNDYYIAKHGYSYVDVYYREEYDVVSNTSVIVIPQITFRHSKYGGTWTVYGTVTIDGRDYSFGGDISSGGVIEHPITSHPIYHDDVTGAKTVTISTACNTVGGSGGTQLYAGNHGTATVTVPLTTIPRISAVKAADGVIGEAVGITVDRSSSLFTHTLRYRFGEATGVIAENTSATELLWTPPMELCSGIPDRASAACSIICETYNGESIIGSRETTITLTVPPEVGLVPMEGWATVQPYHPMLAESGITAFVQGYSKAQVLFDASKISLGKSYGASVASFSVVHNGSEISAPYVTSVLQTAGETELICRVTDTRGKVVSQAVSITVEAYSKPTLSQITVFRCTSDGTENDEGTYVSVTATGNFSSIAGQNRGMLHVAVGDVVSCEIPNGVTTVLGDGAILNTSTYLMTLTFTDRLGNKATYTQLLPTADVMFHGRKGGRGAAFGKYAEQDDLLEVDWNLRVRKNLTVDGEVTVGGKSLTELLTEQTDPLRYMPVGYVYLSLDATSPAALFGGTWERIVDRFLLAGSSVSYPVGSTGGAATHTLTISEMPRHQHIYTLSGGSLTGGTGHADWSQGAHQEWSTQATGGSAAHNNMPPYLSVYMWKRIA